MDITRINCPMRHENGNCLPCGGFCLAVSNEICRGLRNAYRDGVASKVVHGRWYKYIDDDDDKCCRCTACGWRICYEDCSIEELGYNYCPNCGAKMDGDVNGQ